MHKSNRQQKRQSKNTARKKRKRPKLNKGYKLPKNVIHKTKMLELIESEFIFEQLLTLHNFRQEMRDYKLAKSVIEDELKKPEKFQDKDLIETMYMIKCPSEAIRIAAWVFANSNGHMDFDQYDTLLESLLILQEAGMKDSKLWEVTNEAMFTFKKTGCRFDSCLEIINNSAKTVAKENGHES